MTNKKEMEKVIEPIDETKQNKGKTEEVTNISEENVKIVEKKEEPVVNEVQGPKEETTPEKVVEEEQLTSLDILWQHVFKELDEWGAHGETRDENFLKEARYYVESIRRNQDGIAAVTDQFTREFLNWEKSARDEFLMSTTSLQHFFPLKSYEEINQQIDSIQTRTLSIISAPIQVISNFQVMDKYLQMIEQYISLRKRSRLQYINTIKQAANLVYENQKGFVNLFSKPLKAFMFPFNKYLEKTEELTKS